MKFFTGIVGSFALARGLSGVAASDMETPEEQLANLLMSASAGDTQHVEGMAPQYGYLGMQSASDEFAPMMQFDVTRLVQTFGKKMAVARQMSEEGKSLEEFSPVQAAEGYYPPRQDPERYFCPICEDNTFYPYGRCKVSEKKYVANIASCESYCESLVYNQAVTFMSYGGHKGRYAGMCICYKYKPYTKPVKCPGVGAASYPITVKNYFIDSSLCDFQFYASCAKQCQKGCRINAWLNGRPNAIYSFEGYKKPRCDKDDDWDSGKGRPCDNYYGGCPPTPQWKPPRLLVNCKCFWKVTKWNICKRYGAQIGTGASCLYYVTGEECYKCRKDDWKGDDCRKCPDYPYKRY